MGPALSGEARKRVAWFDHYAAHGRNAAFTCRYFGIGRNTFYRWLARYDPRDLSTLEDRSHRPRRVRVPTWTLSEIAAVRDLRRRYPRWGKDKLAVLLKRQGLSLSSSRVGRILVFLKRRGELVEPPRTGISARRQHPPRPWAVRKPKDYVPTAPGDLVQLDTVDVRPAADKVLKQYTARDAVSRWDVIEAHLRATAPSATLFLDTLQARMPFPIRALQVDGGPEFMAGFEAECRLRGILLFSLPPRSPKLNGRVERANRTHTEEFYEVTDFPLQLAALNQRLRQWEAVYNHVRPHQALGYLTPAEFLARWQADQPPGVCH
jgi:putative transposase